MVATNSGLDGAKAMTWWDVFWVMILVASLNLFFKDKQSRRHYRNIMKETITADTVLLNKYDSLITENR